MDTAENLDTIDNAAQVDETNIGAPAISDTEKEARMLGWRSQEEYKGEGWKPAEDYVAAKKTTLTTEVRALRNSFSQMQKANQAFLENQVRIEEAKHKEGYEQAMHEINSRIIDAAKIGNVDAVTKLNSARDNIVRTDELRRVTNATIAQSEDPIISDWKTQNSWFEKDEDLTRYARAYELELTKKGVPLDTRLEMTQKKVKEAFPYKFDQQRRQQNTTLTTNNRTVNNVNKQVQSGTFEALTPEAQKECDKAFSTLGLNMQRDPKAQEKYRTNYARYAKPEMFKS